ncbi:hypothetical protein [Duganella sp. CF458]|uniref:hypothetical protein n=1 Tax=Duganella sp. CF458 TaxID=1884368 RepID=UPI000B89A4FA|nr:hypothetical protein [Duganella sp. CF458]
MRLTRYFQIHLIALSGFLLMSVSQAAPSVSYFPAQDLGQFLAQEFDVATIRSSLGPRRMPTQRTFLSLGLKPSKVSNDSLVFLSQGDWLYELHVIGRRDVNGDGVEDLEVCFIDRALNGGSYNTSTGLLITRYSKDSYAVALNFGLSNGVCEEYAK